MSMMEWTPFTAWNWIAVGVVVAFVALAWRTLRATHGPHTRRRLLWLALRGVLLAILLAILLHPHRVERREFREPLDVAVVLDDSASMTLRDELGVNSTCGASNLSFGLPNRLGLNTTFVAMAAGAGLTSAIVNPLHPEMMASIRAANVVNATDKDCMGWIKACRAQAGTAAGRTRK